MTCSQAPDAFEPGCRQLLHSDSWISRCSNQTSSPPSPVEYRHGSEDLRIIDDASKRQLWWDKTMCDTLGLPSSYRNVGVMLVKWHREIDQYKERTEREVTQLKAIFEDHFHYDVRVCNLVHNRQRTPEVYFEHEVIKFVKDFNNSNDLLIIYYSGHGSFDHENKCLELHPQEEGEPCPRKGNHDPRLKWNVAEKVLMDDARGDVLVILDACFAGNLKEAIPQRDLGRAYEFLAACPRDKSTDPPGRRSFTNSMVHCLEEIVKKESAFTIPQLLTAIFQRKERQGRPPDFWTRSSNTQRSIRLAPLPRSAEEAGFSSATQEKYFNEEPISQYLNLRIELKDFGPPDQAHIEELARNISFAVKNSSIQTRRVDYVSIEPRAKKCLRKVVQFLGHLSRWRSPLLEKETTPTFEEESRPMFQNPVASLADVLAQAESASGRKRCRTSEPPDVMLGPPAKRRASGSTTTVADFATDAQPLTPNSGAESALKTE